VLTLFFTAGAFASAAIPQGVIVAATGDGGETVFTVPMTWMMTGLCGIVATFGVYLINRLDKLDTSVAAHAVRLAHGDEQLKIMREVKDDVRHIKEHGCTRFADVHLPKSPPPQY